MYYSKQGQSGPVKFADAVIVGAGILGLSLACELAQRSCRVVVLESGHSGDGATGSGFAWINATSKIDDERYHRLNAQAMEHYGRLEEQFGRRRLGLHGGGTLYWVAGDDAPGREALERREARLRAWAYPVERLDRHAATVLEPQATLPDGAEGLYAPIDRWLDTSRFLEFLMRRAREYGAELCEQTVVTGFTRDATGISAVLTAQKRIETRTVVLAAGIATNSLLALAAGEAGATAPFSVRRIPGLLVETAGGSAPEGVHRVLYPPDAGGLHLRPTPGGGLLIGADDADAQVSVDEDIPYDLAPTLIDRVLRFLPQLSRERLLTGMTARVCVRPVPEDGFPIVGPIAGVAGLYVAVTHSGVTLGPLLAQLLAEEIVSANAPPLLTPYRPARFRIPQ
jgi:glycine/D-amino acid oxidase-like deaminating enzyme